MRRIQTPEKNNESLLLIEKHTYTLFEQTKTKPQETLEFELNKQKVTFSYKLLMNFSVKKKVYSSNSF